MDPQKLLITSLMFTLLVNFVSSLKVENPNDKWRSVDCRLTNIDLKEIISVIGGKIGQDFDVSSQNDCYELTVKTVSFSSKMRNIYEEKMITTKQNYNETNVRLLQEQNIVKKGLINIPANFRKEYGEAFNQSSEQIRTIRGLMENELKTQAGLLISLDFYTKSLLPRISALDEKNCPLTDDTGRRLISIFKEIFIAVTGQTFDESCKSLIKTFMNVDSFITHTENLNEKKKKLLIAVYEERKRIIQKLVDDNTNERRDYEGLKDNFEDFQKQLNDTFTDNNNIRKEIAEKSFLFIVKMIREGRNFHEIKLAVDYSKQTDPNVFSKALTSAYDCDARYLENAMIFSDYYGRSGFESIYNKMVECNQLEDPLILKINKVLNVESLEDKVELVYNTFSQQIRDNKTIEVLKFIKKFQADIIDLPKLIKTTYNRDVKNMLVLTQLIDQLDLPDQKLEAVLYEQLIKNGGVDTVEHVMFGFWMMKKLKDVEYKDWSPSVIESRRRNLNVVKDQLPDGIKILFFEPYIIFSREDFKYLIRGFGHESVKFQAIPSNEGRYFRIEDTRDHKALYYTKLSNNQDVVMVGHGISQSYYWQIVPTENAKFFFIKNFLNDLALSSEELKQCAKWNAGWFSKDCVKYEYYNKAFLGTSKPSQKWMITTTLIRDGILADRTHNRVPNRV